MASIIEMPKLSDTMSVGTLVSWLKKEGDKVASGDRVAEIETDKATMEMEVFEDGVLLKHFIKAGEQVAVGAPICAIGKAGEKVEAPAKAESPAPAKTEPAKAEPPAARKPAEAAPAPAEKSAPAPERVASSAPAAPERANGERLRISPLARKLAAEKGVDPAGLRGSGPGGRILRADIEAAAAAPKAAAAPNDPAKAAATAPDFVGTAGAPVQEEKAVAVSAMRAVIARRLLESKTQIPHFYLEIDVDAGPLLDLRQQINATFGESAKVSVNDLILKACAHALRRVPAANCSWEGSTIRQHASANVSFAVAIDEGLITPVVFDAHAKSLFQISAEARALAAKAKAKKLQPAEFTGGTFCVSNLGMFGIPRFHAIINPPNGAILAVGATVKKPVVNARDEIVVGQVMTLSLSCDHRVVDGAVGARFLAALKEILEKPLLILG